ERVAERARALLGRELTADELAAERTTYRYNTLGKLASRTEAQTGITLVNGFADRDRALTLYGYDLLGRLTRQYDANGNQTLRQLLAGSADAVVRQWAADGTLRSNGYNAFGEATQVIDEAGNATTQDYDRLGRLVRIYRTVDRLVDVDTADGRAQIKKVEAEDIYSYDAFGHQLTHGRLLNRIQTPNGTQGAYLTTRTDYDELGRVYATTTAAGAQTFYKYQSKMVTGLNGVQQMGTITTTTLWSIGHHMVDEVDYFGHRTFHEDQGGHKFTYTYDAAARLVRQTNDAAEFTQKQDLQFTYYANGALRSQADALEHTIADYTYDDGGNRIAEAYHQWANGQRVSTYRSNTLSYDELNRVVQVADANYYSVRYEYDAVGNRRFIEANYADGSTAPRRQQTYWYAYDAMNRMTVSKGQLSGLDGKPHERAGSSVIGSSIVITAGPEGTVLGYNALGQRAVAEYTAKDAARPEQPGRKVTERYTVSTDGYVLAATGRDGAGATYNLFRAVDAIGRTEIEVDTQNRMRTVTQYDNDNRLQQQTVEDSRGDKPVSTVTTFKYEGVGADHLTARGAGALGQTVTVTGNTSRTTSYFYSYWDDARQSRVDKNGSNGGGVDLTYNANGHLVSENDRVANLTTTFLNDANGLILQRDRQQNNVAVGSHLFFYADGKRVGDLRNDPGDNAHQSLAEELVEKGQTPPDNRQLSSSFKPVVVGEFDTNFEPVNDASAGGASTSYTVNAGDTLGGVAQQLWGDASLWYLIAEANGMSGMEALQAGQVLQVPTRVTNLHHTDQTVRPYNLSEAIGQVDPTVPRGGQNQHCGALAMVLIVAVSVAVTAFTAGAAAPLLAPLAATITTTGTAVLGAAIGAAAGSAASQGIAISLGMQDKFNWKAVGQAALGAAVTAGVGEALDKLELLRKTDGLRGALNSAGRAAIGTGTNLLIHGDWSWKQVMASAAGAGAKALVGDYLGGTSIGKSLGGLPTQLGAGFAGGVVGQWSGPGGKADYAGVFASTVGQIWGDVIGGPLAAVANEQVSRLMEPRPILSAYGQAFNDTFAAMVAGQAQLPAPSLAEARQTADNLATTTQVAPGTFKHVYPDGRVVVDESPYPSAPNTPDSQAERDGLQRRFDDERRAQNPAARAATLERSKSFAEDFADRKAARAESLSWLNQESPVLGPLNDAATDLAIEVGRNYPTVGGGLQLLREGFLGDGSNADLLLMAAGPLGRAEGKAALTAEERLAIRAEATEARAGAAKLGDAADSLVNHPNYVSSLPFSYKEAPFRRFVQRFGDEFSAAGYDDVQGFMQGSTASGFKH
ncbi:MAG TPA: LysM peptidoglycan-binding domain-containing protein, partial [Burkholderiaceae bacterium]|nr:LysM peptidoglycan-binding domain-containing protein [Burkholderiaceae bacterium]